MTHVLVLGGSGFIGRHLVPMLLAEGYQVSLLNRGSHRMPGTTQLLADRNDADSMRKALASTPCFDVVIDLSAYTSAQSRIARLFLSERTGHWIHLSTAAVYTKGTRECDPIGANPDWGQYGADKAEIDADFLGQTGVTILRPPYIYGPYNSNDRETFIWSRLLRGRPIVVPGDGNRQVQFIYAPDLARAFVQFARAVPPTETQIFNIAHPTLLSFNAWVQLLADIAGTPCDIVPELGQSGMNPRSYFPFRDAPCAVDTSAISALWTPLWDARAGFEATWRTQDTLFLKERPIDTENEEKCLKQAKKNASI